MDPSQHRDRQALKRLRKMESSVSLRMGTLITKSVLKPWRLPFLPITFPLLLLRILAELMGMIEPPLGRVEWSRKLITTQTLLVFVEGISNKWVHKIIEFINDMEKAAPSIHIVVMTTTENAKSFFDSSIECYIVPSRQTISISNRDDWSTMIEEQLGGLVAFYNPNVIMTASLHLHRSIINVKRGLEDTPLVWNQIHLSDQKTKPKRTIYAFVDYVLREVDSSQITSGDAACVITDSHGIAAWVIDCFDTISNDVSERNSQREIVELLTESALGCDRKTTLIQEEIHRLWKLKPVGEMIPALHEVIINLERSQKGDPVAARDFHVAAVRTLSDFDIEFAIEFGLWRIHRYKDERVAKSLTQHLVKISEFHSASPLLQYVRSSDWKDRYAATVAKGLLKDTSNIVTTNEAISNIRSNKDSLWTISSRPTASVLEQISEEELSSSLIRRLNRVTLDTLISELENVLRALSRTSSVRAEVITTKIIRSLEVPAAKPWQDFALSWFDQNSRDPRHFSAIASLLFAGGNWKEAERVISYAEGFDNIQRQRLMIKNAYSKLSGSWNLEPVKSDNKKKKYSPIKNSVLYLAHMSLPFENAGYCTRTHGMIIEYAKTNPNIHVALRFGYPLDKHKLASLEEVEPEVIIDGIRYAFSPDSNGMKESDEDQYIDLATRDLIKRAYKEKPALIHAASNYLNGAIGLKAARSLGIPFIYEVRGLWHMSRAARDKSFTVDHSIYQAMDLAEIEVAKGADLVFAITYAVKNHLIAGGVDPERIRVLPNATNTDRFQPIEKDLKLKKELGITEEIIIGYVGSLVDYEGLKYLLIAFSNLPPDLSVSLLIVGDGSSRKELEKKAKELQIYERVRFTGRVPHEDVEKYHSLIDIAPFPRTGDIVCEFISPLKPFEAMAMGQVVVASDVAALSEIITDGKNGRLFRKDDPEHLRNVLLDLITDSDQRDILKKSGRKYVVEERQWSTISEKIFAGHQAVFTDNKMEEDLEIGKLLTIVNGKVFQTLNRKPKVMAIMDRFSTTAIEFDVTLTQPKPNNYADLLKNNEFDALIVESAWVGNDESWHRKVGWYSENEISDLVKLVNLCRIKNIPTIFYNKEDPVHFNRFGKTSTLFEHVFTTDFNCITKYKELKSSITKTVNSITFAAQPAVHHPWGAPLKNRSGIAFAGTYYSGKYLDRCERMDMLLDASIDYNLIIYDRQSDGANPQYIFPDRFSSNIHPKLEYDEMLNAHRQHRILLNVNSVENSPTMAARRIFEIPASGAALISSPGDAVQNVYGNIVPIVSTPEEASNTISALCTDDDLWWSTVTRSRRIVLDAHLNQHRLNQMFNEAAIRFNDNRIEKLIIDCRDYTADGTELLIQLANQTLKPSGVLLPNDLDNQLLEILTAWCKSNDIVIFSETEQESYSGEVVSLNHQQLKISTCLEDILHQLNLESHDIVLSSNLEDAYALITGRLSTKMGTEITIRGMGKYRMLPLLMPTAHDSLPVRPSVIPKLGTIPKKILVAGHDLKFARPIIKFYESLGIEILIDQWGNHDRFNPKVSKQLLQQVDAVWCEWALGNVKWYSRNIQPDIPLITRFHLQEKDLEYLSDADINRIDAIAFVGNQVRIDGMKAHNLKPISDKCYVVPNAISVIKPIVKPSSSNYTLGMVGIVPKRKRLDLALDMLKELKKKDSRYNLLIAGKEPKDFEWLIARKEEMAYFTEQYDRIAKDDELKNSVKFVGFVPSIAEFFSSVQHVISVSDFESFHLTLADGPMHGCHAISTKWDGIADIYPPSFYCENILDIVERIHQLTISSRVSFVANQQCDYVKEKMTVERVGFELLSLMQRGGDSK